MPPRPTQPEPGTVMRAARIAIGTMALAVEATSQELPRNLTTQTHRRSALAADALAVAGE